MQGNMMSTPAVSGRRPSRLHIDSSLSIEVTPSCHPSPHHPMLISHANAADHQLGSLSPVDVRQQWMTVVKMPPVPSFPSTHFPPSHHIQLRKIQII